MAKTMDDDKQYELKYTGDIDNITLVGGDPLIAQVNKFEMGGPKKKETPLEYTHRRFPITEFLDVHPYLDSNFTPKDMNPRFGDIEYIQAKYNTLPYYNDYSKPDSLIGKSAIVYNDRLGDFTNESVALDALSHGLREQDPVWQKEYIPTLNDAFKNHFEHWKLDNQEDKDAYVDGFIRNMVADPSIKREMGYWDEELQEAAQNPAIHNALTEAYSYINPTQLPEIIVEGNQQSEGGSLNTYKQWNDLSIKERAEMMKVAIKNGITDLSDIKNKYNEFALGGHVYSGVDTATQKMQDMDWMKGPVYEVLPRLFRMAGISVQVTSGKRKPRYSDDHSHHIEGNAVDIIPLGKSTFEDIENAAYTNPLIKSYMLEHKLGILDETGRTPESVALMKKTKATGPHLHFGIDSKPAAAYAARFNGNANSSSVNSKWEKRAESYWNRAQPMYQEMLDAGINPVAAAGILGNIAQESAFNPYASNNTSGGHWGYLQNDKNIHPWMTTHYGNDHAGQMNYIVAGLQGRLPKDNMGLDKRFNSFNAKMNGVTDPEMAAYLWEKEYERSANENIPERKYFAKYFYDKMMGNNQSSSLPSREIENPYFDFTPQNPELLQQAMSGNTPDYTQDYNNYALAARNAVLEDKLAQQQEEQARVAESAARAAQRQRQMGLLSYVMNMYSPDRSQSPYIGVFNLLANNGQGDNIAAYGGHLFETGGPEKYRRVLPPYSTDEYHVEVPDAIPPRAMAISPIMQDVSRDAAIDRTNRVYSNYSEAKDSPLSNTQEAFYNSLRYLKDNVWDSIPSGVSNCTLTASQWIDPSNPVKNASSIVNNPSTYGYTKINDLDAIPGDLLIAKMPDKDSYHSMLITGFTDKDGVYEMDGKKFRYKKGEPLLTYSRGGHDTSFIRKGVPLSVYTANSDGHTDNLYYRYNYPNEVFLPPIEVYPR